MNWLRLIRWNNLFIILLTQALVWFCVLLPLRRWTNERLLLDTTYFSLLCLSTILIAAAGYIINDYFDIKIDAINRPEKVILENKIHRRAAIIYHSVLNIIGSAIYIFSPLSLFSDESIFIKYLDDIFILIVVLKVMSHETHRYTRYKAKNRRFCD